jgi:hypothetical protein
MIFIFINVFLFILHSGDKVVHLDMRLLVASFYPEKLKLLLGSFSHGDINQALQDGQQVRNFSLKLSVLL